MVSFRAVNRDPLPSASRCPTIRFNPFNASSVALISLSKSTAASGTAHITNGQKSGRQRGSSLHAAGRSLTQLPVVLDKVHLGEEVDVGQLHVQHGGQGGTQY